MTLVPVRSYADARYPTLVEQLSHRRRGNVVFRLALATGLAALATLVTGCTISG